MQDSQPIFLTNTLSFVHALRQAGIAVSVGQSADFTHALTLIDIGSRDQVFYSARGLLLDRYENLRLFETIFNRFWVANHTPAPRGRTTKPKARRRRGDIVALMADKAADAKPIEVEDKSRAFSSAEILQNKLFRLMNEEELAAVKQTMQQMKWRIAQRITRRRVADRHGDQLHLRRILRSTTKYGGVPMQLAYRRRKIKPRPVVLLADISGSMERYARLLLQFFYSVAHSQYKVESFVFGTRLTRITNQLKLKNIDTAIDQASRQVVDWAGGTRIGASLARFNREWSRRVLRRGALVIIISDGWERGDTTQLRDAMRFLQHRSHRLIWLNPLSADPNYQPLVSGMATALPYVDDFLPIHNLNSLRDLATHLEHLN